jgi:uncharacterized low-complexity protein
MKRRLPLLPLRISLCHVQTFAQSFGARSLGGALVTGKNEAVAGATVAALSSSGERTVKSDAEGFCCKEWMGTQKARSRLLVRRQS